MTSCIPLSPRWRVRHRLWRATLLRWRNSRRQANSRGRLGWSRRWRSILVLTSHKMLRWLTAPLLAIGVIATVALAGRGGTFRVVLGMEILFALIAAIGMVASRRGTEGKATLAYQFVALNCAQAVGLWRCFSGEVPVVWEPRNL